MSDTLEDLIKDIPSSLLDQECCDKYLATVSKELKNWKLLRPYLNMTDVEQHSISESSHDYDEQKQSLLFKWKSKFSASATYRVLLKAIVNSRDINLAGHASQLLRQQHQQTGNAMTPVAPPAVMEYRNTLKSVYNSFNINPIVVDDWPPPPTHKYIRLVLIPKEPLQRGGIDNSEIYASISGSVDDNTAHTDKEADLEELLKQNFNKRQVILFEGSSGSGKSTLLWHICQKWQLGELFQQFKLVLLVQLRDQAAREANYLAEILPYGPSRTSRAAQIKESYAAGIEDIQGEGVLIMLDGWDEAPARLRQKGSLIYDLIASPYECSIEKAVVVVTSRPHACRELRKLSTSRIELRGFTEESRQKYIREVLQPDIAQKLVEEIDNIDRVVDLSHPLNIVNLTHIYSASGYVLPTSPCRITIKIIQCYLLRHIWKLHGDKSPEALNSLDDLPHPIDKSFHTLCKIAYDGIVGEKYAFTANELKEVPVLPETGTRTEIETLSLLQARHSLIATGFSTHYHFLHLSFQELCAAYHIVRLPDPETTHKKALEDIVTTFFKPKDSEIGEYFSFESVCNYYSALTKLENLTVARQIKGIYRMYDSFDSKRDFLHDESSSSDGEFASQNGPSDLDSESSLENEHSNFDSEPEMQVDATAWIFSEIDVFESYDQRLFAITSTGEYRYSSFFEFLMESKNAEFVNEVVGEKMRVRDEWDDYTTGVLSAVVNMCSMLESVTCYGISEKMGAALSHKKHLAKFAVKIFDSVHCLKDFRSVLNVLQTCLSIIDFDIKAHFSESVAVLAASKLAMVFQKMSLQKCTIIAHDSLQDDAIAALAPAFGRISTVRIQCKQIGPLSLGRFAVTFSPSNSLTCLHINVQHYEGDDRAFFSSLKNAPSLTTIGPSGTGSDPPSVTSTSVGRALLSGNLKELADILSLRSPPTVQKIMTIFVFGNLFMKVDFKDQIFVSVGPVSGLNIYHFYGSYENKPKIFRCKIGSTEMETLSKTLKEVQVRSLYLYTHTIGDEGAMFLGETLRTTSCLEELIIRDCGIGADGISQLFACLTENATLVTLDASFNPFGDDGATMVAPLINETSIEVLDISNCNVGEKGMVAIASVLHKNATLRSLSLYSPNVISKNGEIELTKMLIRNTTLKVLEVNQTHDRIQHSLFYSSTHSMFEVSHISTCSLMSSNGTSEFYHGLKMSNIIASIEIPKESGLGMALWAYKMQEAVDIMQLQQPPNGEKRMKLCMSGNTWTVDYVHGTIEEKDEGLRKLRHICSSPECWTQLRELDLENQMLGNVGACLLAEILNQTQLQDLNIACCGIGEEGIISLASALSTNTTIQHLAIGSNQISVHGQSALVESLSRNTILVSLDTTSKKDKWPMRMNYVASFVGDEDNFIHRMDELSSLTKVRFDSNTTTGRNLEAIHLPVNDRSCDNAIECQLKPIRVAKIYRKTDLSKVLYHCTA